MIARVGTLMNKQYGASVTCTNVMRICNISIADFISRLVNDVNREGLRAVVRVVTYSTLTIYRYYNCFAVFFPRPLFDVKDSK